MDTLHCQYTHKNVSLVPYDFEPSPKHWYFDPDVTALNSWGIFTLSPETEEKALKEAISARKIIMWKIYSTAEGKNTWVGNVSIQSLDWINRSAEFAILIGEKEYWGKGIASSALFMCMQHVFDKLAFRRFWSGTSALNIGMQKVFKKHKWTQEGVFRNAKFTHGQEVDIFEYSILSAEYYTYVKP